MKRILTIAVLAVLLLATVGATTAAAAKQKTVVTGKIYASNMDCSAVGAILGTVTFNTDTGAWAITQKTNAALPPAEHGIYYLGITSSRAVHGLTDGGYGLSGEIYVNADGTISQSGVSAGTGTTVNDCLANGGVFVLMTYSSP